MEAGGARQLHLRGDHAVLRRVDLDIWWKEFAEFFLMLESQLVTPCILTIFGKSKIGEYLDTRNQPNIPFIWYFRCMDIHPLFL